MWRFEIRQMAEGTKFKDINLRIASIKSLLALLMFEKAAAFVLLWKKHKYKQNTAHYTYMSSSGRSSSKAIIVYKFNKIIMRHRRVWIHQDAQLEK